MRRLSLLAATLLACAVPAPRADGWRIIGPGGGGSLFHPTVSPHDSRTVLVACDMTGAYLTHDGGAHWRIVNLGEPVRFFVFDPVDANVIYAKALGIMRSADNGETWTRFFPRDVRNVTMGDDHAEGYLHTAGGPAGEVTALADRPGRFAIALPCVGGRSMDLRGCRRHLAEIRRPGRTGAADLDRRAFAEG